jgi:DNA-binding transcriptional LysR family regulator
VPSIATTLLPVVIAQFRSQWPAVEITARDADSRSVADLVQSGAVELGIASLPSERRALLFTPLFEEPLGIVCRRDDPLYRKRGSRRWSDLEGRTLLANAISDSQNIGAVPPPAQAPIVVYNVLSLLALVRAKIGVTILPQLSVSEPQPDIGFVPIDEPDARRTVGVITRAGEGLSPATAALLQIVRNQLQDIAGDFAITLRDNAIR